MPRAVTPPSDASTQPAGLEPGSFRDPESRVFYAGDEVYRALSADGLSDFEALQASGLLDDPRIVRDRAGRATWRAPPARACSSTSPPRCCATSASRSSRIRTSGRSRCCKDAALLQLDLLLAALEHDLVLKDSTPYNVQFKGARPVFVDVGLVRAPARGRAVGRLPPVLHALPLPAAAPGGEGRAASIPGCAARSTASRPPRCATCCRSATASAAGCSPTSSCTPGSRRATPTAPSRSSDEVKRRLQEGAVRRQRAQDAQARRAARVGPAARASGPPTASATATPTTTPQRKDEFVRAGRHVAAVGPRLGHRREQRPLLAHRRRGRADGRRGRRRPGAGRAALPRPARGGQRADPHAHDEPRRPVARPRLARARAQGAARPRQARPGAGARARAPRRDQRATCRSRSSSTGSPRSARRS